MLAVVLAARTRLEQQAERVRPPSLSLSSLPAQSVTVSCSSPGFVFSLPALPLLALLLSRPSLLSHIAADVLLHAAVHMRRIEQTERWRRLQRDCDGEAVDALRERERLQEQRQGGQRRSSKRRRKLRDRQQQQRETMEAEAAAAAPEDGEDGVRAAEERRAERRRRRLEARAAARSAAARQQPHCGPAAAGRAGAAGLGSGAAGREGALVLPCLLSACSAAACGAVGQRPPRSAHSR